MTQALIATQRFGLGAGPGELAQVASDPRGWLQSQIGVDEPIPGITSSAERVVALAEARQEVRAMKQADAKNSDAFAQLKAQQRDAYLSDVSARLGAAIASEAPFAERWIRFWSNHFTVSITRPIISGLVVPFENEAVRPHAFGRFADLALAVVRHPAMLLYLDNARSIGPNSQLGRRKEAGLNENLARELMELHTLGVNGGYSQDDVRALAKILTGWTIARPGRMARFLDAVPGTFGFAAAAHEPGEKILLGRRYADNGEAEGIAAIRDLCAHPATAQHVARKIALHFLADEPPQTAVASLADAFTVSGGDLAAVAQRLIALSESWSLPMIKARPPEEWLIAMRRAFAIDGDVPARKSVGVLQQLGQVPFAAPSPAGWPEDSSGWLGPEALMARLDFAGAAAQRIRVAQPATMTDQILGSGVTEESRLQIERAPSAADAVALLLVSPEFMLR
ncbi:MAG TPA: DUF1800 domain-containing protein [Dongiaceae bacterium]|jgi:uncharacterized protein (DUF1800 family)|nr:DUF1800 domain-containing protein [Dongiaceae bacterium]